MTFVFLFPQFFCSLQLIFSIKLLQTSRPDTAYLRPQWELACAIMADDDSEVSPPSSPDAPSVQKAVTALIHHVWEHTLLLLVDVPGITGTTKPSKYWKWLAPGCTQQCSSKNATRALTHGSRDRA
jgi:hypothetical protein